MFKGKTALVTGSTSGIGLGIAGRLAAAGANVILNGLGDAREIEKLRSGLASKYGTSVVYDGADMSRADAIAAMMKSAIAGFTKTVALEVAEHAITVNAVSSSRPSPRLG